MKKLLFIALASVFVFAKCNKDETPTNTTDTYLPNTVGSNWTYARTTTTTTNITYTVASKDTNMLSKTYKVLTGSDNSKQYYAQVNSDYYTTQTISGNTVELNFLKDNKNVNDTWSTSQTLNNLTGLPGGITSVTLNVNYTMQEKGSTRTVSGKSYSDVIKVKADLGVSLPLLGSLSFGYTEFYFAKNIGIIETNIQITNSTAGVNIVQKDLLQSYVIK